MAMHKTVDIGLITSILSWHFLRSHKSSFIHVVTGNGSYVNRAGSGTPRQKERLNINPRQQLINSQNCGNEAAPNKGRRAHFEIFVLCPSDDQMAGKSHVTYSFTLPFIHSFTSTNKTKMAEWKQAFSCQPFPKIRYVYAIYRVLQALLVTDLCSKQCKNHETWPYS